MLFFHLKKPLPKNRKKVITQKKHKERKKRLKNPSLKKTKTKKPQLCKHAAH